MLTTTSLPRWSAVALLLAAGLFSFTESHAFAQTDFVVDDVPDHVTATIQARAKKLAALPQGSGPSFDFFVSDLSKWSPGQTVKVAFLGGSPALHKEIGDATMQITNASNIKLDFGFDPATGKSRTWSMSDVVYAAEIRVSFDQGGYFSLVGRDSNDSTIGGIGQAVGGRPGQRSLNLNGFDKPTRPASWRKTARHEFLHALAFQHEHQSPMGGCDAQFRWDNDPGYAFSQDDSGQFITDPDGKRPGIYTFLSGAPNFWSKQKVDHNLRQAVAGSGTAGTFDRKSIMLYRFPDLFYVTPNSPCSPVGDSEDLSEGDIAGLKTLYPSDEPSMALQVAARKKVLDAIAKSPHFNSKIKSQYNNK